MVLGVKRLIQCVRLAGMLFPPQQSIFISNFYHKRFHTFSNFEPNKTEDTNSPSRQYASLDTVRKVIKRSTPLSLNSPLEQIRIFLV